ncbi:MAG: pyridoxal-dependent decarboxylase [Lachnospiraceae bacterium]|nr:pyridoxal-dependent decarboxylase [Lachnospiraceae bacterium]
MKTLSRELLEKLALEYGDSFYVLDSDVFEENCLSLSTEFKKYYDNFNIAYSYKTNYTPKLVKIVNRLGGFAEVVSDMEVEVALRSGVPYEKIIWNGPVKNKEKVKEVLLNGGTVNVDSFNEFECIKTLAEDNPGYVIRIGLRCNYDVGDGVLSRFGFDVEGNDFDSVLKQICEKDNIKLLSLQVHFAERDPKYWTQRTTKILDVYKKVRNEYGIVPERIDLGGGIYGDMPESLSRQLGTEPPCFKDYADKSAKLFADYFKDEENAPMLLIEPGTAVVANCMRYVCRIETIKQICNKTYASTNGSQKNINVCGINLPMQIIGGGRERKQYSDIDLVGYTCIESDCLYSGYSGEIGIGDYVIFSNCGSYSLVMKPPFIFTNVPVIDISGDMVEIIKRAETFDDLFTTYSF